MKLRNLFFLFGIFGLLLWIMLDHHELSSFWQELKNLRWYVLLAMALIQVAAFYVNAFYYRSILKVFGYKVGVQQLFEGALATNFVNYVLPTLGLAGAGYLSQVLHGKVPRGESFLAQLMRYALSGLAVLTLMPIGFVVIILTDHTASKIVNIALAASAIVIGLAIGVIVLIQKEAVLRRFAKWLISHLRKLAPKLKVEAADLFIDEFYTGYRTITKKKRKVVPSYAWSIVYIFIQIFAFYLVFLAFGKAINPGIVIMAYLLANIASIFGGVLFSFGVFELGMTGTLVALGLPLSLALSATTVYRVLNLVVGLPPGLFFYRKYLS
ncbi:MAG TPA: lysylphosphatidylglycerol synthase transmembrane domain-containing protein [Candidatus Binatia bacterium]|nr:lysylphosphatidylglycerol synthase transmembrane domain-containing protein [Candidatus Binatia bacterium]